MKTIIENDAALLESLELPDKGWLIAVGDGYDCYYFCSTESWGISFFCDRVMLDCFCEDSDRVPVECTFDEARDIAKGMDDSVSGIVVWKDIDPVNFHFVK